MDPKIKTILKMKTAPEKETTKIMKTDKKTDIHFDFPNLYEEGRFYNKKEVENIQALKN